jgi:AraC-like DNA-binding protein
MRTDLDVQGEGAAATGQFAAMSLQTGRRAGPVEQAVRVGLRHTDLVLKLSVEPAGIGVLDHGLPGDFDASDPVMDRLISAIGQSAAIENDNGVHLDAIRLALIVRWLEKRVRVREADDRPTVHPLQKWRMKIVENFVDQNLDKPISLADLAKAAGLSPMYFAAQFRAATGLRPHDYLLQRRIERAKELLAVPNSRLIEIALEVGFQTQAHFTTVFKRFVGTTPARWRAIYRTAA